ncbi:MAG: BirA family transcriptional regulator [Solirubrobacterales bacterium]|jgi:BirA family biotin operon repressor/biotin-[acetyl-CoA-carboxylase] ligase|nr:BirA family transcriptional regulator [Solirubrobacterales bacterium]
MPADMPLRFGSPHRHFRVTDSTNSRARELAEAGAPGGTVLTAREQIAGRGRQGRVWTAPEGKALLYSAILKPLDGRNLLLPLSVPLAVCAAAETLCPGAKCMVKWPNDVWLDGRKLAGILIEAKPQERWAVIGVGLNLSIEPAEFPDDLRQPAISLGGGTTAEQARCELDANLTNWAYAPEEKILAEWRRRDGLLGREVSWEDGSGVADGIDDRGNLVVVVPGGGRVSLGAGEVQLRL